MNVEIFFINRKIYDEIINGDNKFVIVNKDNKDHLVAIHRIHPQENGFVCQLKFVYHKPYWAHVEKVNFEFTKNHDEVNVIFPDEKTLLKGLRFYLFMPKDDVLTVNFANFIDDSLILN